MIADMTAIMVFTRDLRVHDHPALQAAIDSQREVVPLFVVDDKILRGPNASPNRNRFLRDCLVDLDTSLKHLGGRLIVRAGGFASVVARLASEVGADSVHLSHDISRYAQARVQRLREAVPAGCAVRTHPGITVLDPGQATAAGKDHAVVFTPYWRKWDTAPKRPVVAAPRQVRVPEHVRSDRLPSLAAVHASGTAAGLPAGGESTGRQLWKTRLDNNLSTYATGQDAPAADRTSRLSPYLHFGCLSANELVAALTAGASEHSDGTAAFVRQLCWRDFHHQVLAARPLASRADYRDRGDVWREDSEAFESWTAGTTGYPLVDAGMRQLLAEGWMHNRARLVTSSFLVKDLYIDWRLGARHFMRHLVDGDVANNQLNWQWVAGTGTDTRPNRVLNPLRQAERYDPHGDYVRQYVPELRSIAGPHVHAPWKLPDHEFSRLDYPAPLVDHADAVQYFRQARGN